VNAYHNLEQGHYGAAAIDAVNGAMSAAGVTYAGSSKKSFDAARQAAQTPKGVPAVVYQRPGKVARTVAVHDKKAYYKSSGEAKRAGQSTKQEGEWYRTWGVQEQPVPMSRAGRGYITKSPTLGGPEVHNPGMKSLEPAMDVHGTATTPEQLNGWLDANGVTPQQFRTIADELH
jgi:hypothetical protein